ncbi:OmpA family protein [Pseudodesulfovibrio sp. zrk46]|uniref:OmpA family protein n=1 Tax=Pseudodesulfovibrio sp. zrk46 TaxID=2725288 RepID=UPI0014491727|nr:OmpA family protein [Pseudodesulfovibrio sp. zrk46]QJB55525.1 OmpA family protein [Pseudodesulfovibrio sp. zrk46]
MKQNKKLLLLALVAAMTLSFALVGPASAKMVKKVDNFIFFLDQSGSMAQKHQDAGKKKIDMAIETMQAMNKAVPALDYTAGTFLFAPFQAVSQPGAYNQSGMMNAIGGIGTDFDIFNRRTDMGGGLMDIDPVIAGLSGKTGLIIFTDGNANYGADPIAQAKALYSKYGDKLCIHVVSYADTPHGKMVIDEIRALSSCTVVADYASLMAPGAMDKYAKDVFYEEVADAPKAAPVPMAKETITFSLHFGFDKYQITDEMIPVLEQAKMILEEDSNAMFEVAGHTDATGPEAYNQGLSERRAASVKNWLVANGVPASRLEAKGYGELSPKYDNNTKEGRKLNRRVEIQTK